MSTPMPEQYVDMLRLAERKFDEVVELLRATLRTNLDPKRKAKVADLLALTRMAGQTARRYAKE
jgi:hypothetical protein